MMREYNFGNICKRHLMIRTYSRNRPRFECRIKIYPGHNSRCYCPTGNSATAHLCLFGYSITAFYSHFNGKTPCPCDIAIWEMFPEEHAEELEELRETAKGDICS